MSAQLDMFGGSKPDIPPKVSKKTRGPHGVLTCWKDCLHCGNVFLAYRNRTFRPCKYPGREQVRCYEKDAICTHASIRREAPQAKPSTAGWEDY